MAKQLDIKTLAQLIYAQNFSMPAGYVADKSGESWLLKVGEEYDSVSDIEGALLLHVDGFGDVRLSDVADVAVIDNAEAVNKVAPTLGQQILLEVSPAKKLSVEQITPSSIFE